MDNPETYGSIGTYELTCPMTSKNGGCSIWAFGKKGGKDFFIKQFLSPKYPENDTVMSPERLQKRREQCEEFERRKAAIYRSMNENSNGVTVRAAEFFRVGSKYYMAMPKIEAVSRTMEEICAQPKAEIRLLCATVAGGVATLHKGGIVHADLKPDNILYTRSKSGAVVAKIIDVDAGFLESDPPRPGEDVSGDFVYMSPEVFWWSCGHEVPLTCKMDIFALGVLFHQYFTGELPGFDCSRSDYAGAAVADGEVLAVSDKVPPEYRELLQQMLTADPAQRPTAEEVFSAFKAKAQVPQMTAKPTSTLVMPPPPPPTAPVKPPEVAKANMGKWFGQGGDL